MREEEGGRGAGGPAAVFCAQDTDAEVGGDLIYAGGRGQRVQVKDASGKGLAGGSGWGEVRAEHSLLGRRTPLCVFSGHCLWPRLPSDVHLSRLLPR